MKARAKIIRWIAIILVLVTIAAFFLPYVSSIGNAREVYERLSDDTASEKPHMTYGQLKDLSLFEYVKLYI